MFDSVLGFHRYGDSFIVAGGYAFVSWITTDQRYKVARLNLTTGESDGVVDMGAMPSGDFHFYAALALDPTDNRLLWASVGRPDGGVDIPGLIRKTAHPFGGSTAEWAANDFGAGAQLPRPATGSVSYLHMKFTENGTLLIFGSHRASVSNPGGNTPDHGGYLYRCLGNGTSKSESQLVQGSWTKVIDAIPDTVPSTFSGVIYPQQTVYKNGRYAVCYGYLETLLNPSPDNASGTSPRRGLAYIYTDNIHDPIPTWKNIEGQTLSVPITGEYEERGTNLFVHDTYADYFASMDLDPDGIPFFAQGMWTLDNTAYKNIIGSGVSAFRWSGTSWAETVLTQRDIDRSSGDTPSVRVIYHKGKRILFSNRSIGGARPLAIVIDNLDDGITMLVPDRWYTSYQLAEYDGDIKWAGVLSPEAQLVVSEWTMPTAANPDEPSHAAAMNTLMMGAGF